MKKAFLKILMVTLLISVALFAVACSIITDEQESGITYKKNEDGKSYTVVAIDTRSSVVTIPAEYQGLPVTGINLSRSFYAKGGQDTVIDFTPYHQSVTKIEIPSTVKEIGWFTSTFMNLTEVIVDSENATFKTIDGNLYSKDGSALLGYARGKQQSEFVIPSHVTTIGNEAFAVCPHLKNIVIPDSVTTIKSSAFNGLLITSVKIPKSVVTIEPVAFLGCNQLFDVEINANITGEGDHYASAFYNCDSIMRVTIGEDVEVLNDAVIDKLSSLKIVEVINNSKHITIEKGSDEHGGIGKLALYVANREEGYVSKLSQEGDFWVFTEGEDRILVNYQGVAMDVVVPDDITKINDLAFFGADVATIKTGDGVTEIGMYAFAGERVVSVEIGKNVQTIKESAFEDAYHLVEIINKSEYITLEKGSDEDFYGIEDVEIISNRDDSYVSKVIKEDGFVTFEYESDVYLMAYYGAEVDIIIPTEVTFIHSYAFKGRVINSVVFGENVRYIAKYAFYGCANLTEAKFEDVSNWYFIESNAIEGLEEWEAISVTSSSKNAMLLIQGGAFAKRDE